MFCYLLHHCDNKANNKKNIAVSSNAWIQGEWQGIVTMETCSNYIKGVTVILDANLFFT